MSISFSGLAGSSASGPVYGGSGRRRDHKEAVPKRREPEAGERGLPEGVVHMRGPGIPPGTAAVRGRFPGPAPVQTALPHLPPPGRRAFPPPPEDTAELSPQSFVQRFEDEPPFRQSDVFKPAPPLIAQRRDHPTNILTSFLSGNPPRAVFHPLDRIRSRPQPRGLFLGDPGRLNTFVPKAGPQALFVGLTRGRSRSGSPPPDKPSSCASFNSLTSTGYRSGSGLDNGGLLVLYSIIRHRT